MLILEPNAEAEVAAGAAAGRVGDPKRVAVWKVNSSALLGGSGTDGEYAAFGLAGFIQYRLDDGMELDCLRPFVEAYLNIIASLGGLEPRSYDELRSQIKAAWLKAQSQDHRYWPYWLPDDEKQRCRLPALDTGQNNSSLHGDFYSMHSLTPNAEAHLPLWSAAEKRSGAAIC